MERANEEMNISSSYLLREQELRMHQLQNERITAETSNIQADLSDLKMSLSQLQYSTLEYIPRLSLTSCADHIWLYLNRLRQHCLRFPHLLCLLLQLLFPSLPCLPY